MTAHSPSPVSGKLASLWALHSADGGAIDGKSTPALHLISTEAHITLVHPRNGTCSDAAFEEICAQYAPFTVTLQAVTIIEQADGGRWMDVARFE